MKLSQQDHGLSLLELVAAMAIFALVAVLGVQALSGMIRMREDLIQRSKRAAELDRTVSLLRADLSAVVPMLFYPPERAPPQSAVRFRNGVLALSVSGQSRLTDHGSAGLHRIEWQLQNERLSRRIWPALTPARATAQNPAMPVLEGVTGLRLRSYWETQGWVDGVAPTTLQPTPDTGHASDGDHSGPAPEIYSSTVPLALELILETRNFGRLSLVETLK